MSKQFKLKSATRQLIDQSCKKRSFFVRINDACLMNDCSSSKNKKSRQGQHFVSFLAARLSLVYNNIRRPVAFRPVLADRFGFSVFQPWQIIILLSSLSSFFFGADTSDTIALLKYAHGENSEGENLDISNIYCEPA